MKKSIVRLVILFLLLFLNVSLNLKVEASSGNTEADVTFTQGDTPVKPIEPPSSSKEPNPTSGISGLLPKTGEIVSCLGILVGMVLIGTVYLIVRKKNK